MERYDCVIVGARCAGSPLAALLARRGVRVAVMEQATFPRDTLSTHLIHAQALAFLDRLGVMEQIRATGAPLVSRFDTRQEGLEYSTPIPQQAGDVGGFASVRRALLDPILAQAAVEAGADLRMASKVTELVEDRGRVTGVRVTQNGSDTTLRARLVIGADGRNSTVARLVGARKYNLTPNQRFVYWSFFERADPGSDPACILHHWSDRIVIANPADSGLYQVIVAPDLRELARFRGDLEGSFMEYARSCRPVAQALAGARRVGRTFGMLRWEGFFREASGPGWVLAGDAGHFKDPMPGQGMQDAFRQVDALATAIADALDGSEEDADRTLEAWGRWRDKDAAEHYWFAVDMGKAGTLDAVVPEIQRRLHAQGKIDILTNLFTHRSRPSQVFTPPRLLRATGRLLVEPGCQRRKVLREVGALVVEDVRRRRLNRRPLYAETGTALDAGPTEVDESSETTRSGPVEGVA
jgi:2-polyprenyl-6-methoxyphenol hydroxylase-like FAD-dependent oxidoreductase